MESQPLIDLKAGARPLKAKLPMTESTTELQQLENSSPTKSRSLLDLPPELRFIIYPYVFQSDDSKNTARATLRRLTQLAMPLNRSILPIPHIPYRPRPTYSMRCNTLKPSKPQAADPFTSQSKDLAWRWDTRKDTRLLMVCKLIYDEGAEVLYKHAKFIWPNVLYQPDCIYTLPRPLRSPLYQFIRHVQTEMTVTVNNRLWTAETGPFYSRCVQWRQSLPQLKKVDVLFKFVTRERRSLNERQVCEAAKFIQKLMLPLSNAEHLPIHGKFSRHGDGIGSETKGHYDRVLHIARETLMITKRMSRKGRNLNSIKRADGDHAFPKIPIPLATLWLSPS